MHEIVEINAEQLFAEMGACAEAEILHAQKLLVDGAYVASSGFSRVAGDARIWGFLDIKEPQTPDLGLVIVRTMRSALRKARELKEDIYIQCERSDAARFLTVLGFIPTEEKRVDLRTGEMLGVWVWRH